MAAAAGSAKWHARGNRHGLCCGCRCSLCRFSLRLPRVAASPFATAEAVPCAAVRRSCWLSPPPSVAPPVGAAVALAFAAVRCGFRRSLCHCSLWLVLPTAAAAAVRCIAVRCGRHSLRIPAFVHRPSRQVPSRQVLIQRGLSDVYRFQG